MQTEDLLIKRRTVLEKKMELELQKAKEYTKAKNKRGPARTVCWTSFLIIASSMTQISPVIVHHPVDTVLQQNLHLCNVLPSPLLRIFLLPLELLCLLGQLTSQKQGPKVLTSAGVAQRR